MATFGISFEPALHPIRAFFDAVIFHSDLIIVPESDHCSRTSIQGFQQLVVNNHLKILIGFVFVRKLRTPIGEI